MNHKNIIHYLVLALPGLSVLYLIRLNTFGVPTNVFEILVYLTALYFVFVNRPLLHLSHRGWLIAVVSIVIIVTALITSGDLRTGLGIIKGWIIPATLVFWMLGKHLTSVKDHRLTLKLMLAQGIFVAIVSLLQEFRLISDWWVARAPDLAQYLQNGRNPSVFNSPNSSAIILALSVIVSFYLARRWWHYLFTIGLVLALGSSGSQAGALALGIGIIVYELVQRGYKRLASGIVAICLLVINPLTLSLIASSNPDSVDVRLHIWRKAWEMLWAHPVFGYGLTSFQNAFSAFTLHQPNFDQFITPYAVHPHNIFLYAWFLFGLAGLFGLIYAFWYGMTRAWQRQNALVLAMLTVVLIQGMVDNTVLKNDLIVWFVVLMQLIGHRDVSYNWNLKQNML